VDEKFRQQEMDNTEVKESSIPGAGIQIQKEQCTESDRDFAYGRHWNLCEEEAEEGRHGRQALYPRDR